MVIKLKEIPKEGHYVSIPNSIAQDLTMSVHARSTLMYLLSLPPESKFHISTLIKTLGLNDKRVKAIIKELTQKGYMKSYQIKDEKGRFVRFDYVITPIPFQFSQFIEDLKVCEQQLPF